MTLKTIATLAVSIEAVVLVTLLLMGLAVPTRHFNAWVKATRWSFGVFFATPLAFLLIQLLT